jgi:DNA-binding response OmpR family regulator
MRILVVEDEKKIAEFLRKGLKAEGYAVDVAADGEQGRFLAGNETYDLVVLDLRLPKMDGLTFCRTLRKEKFAAPILMLTARDTVKDKVLGLDSGADDYLTKPFDFGELLARVRALQRRPRGVDAPVVARGDLALDPVRHEVTAGGRPVALTATEYSILELLLRRSPAVVDRKAIAEHAWQDETDPLGSNAIDVQMSRLRAKLPAAGIRIVTVRGAGYRLEES